MGQHKRLLPPKPEHPLNIVKWAKNKFISIYIYTYIHTHSVFTEVWGFMQYLIIT